MVGAEQHIIPHDNTVDEVMYDNYELDPEIGAVIYGTDIEFTH